MGCYRIMCAMGIVNGKRKNGNITMDNGALYG
jgi:hypothetical protein